jgi:hypothetical protein
VRAPVDEGRIRQLMDAFGREAGHPLHVYLVGGATAVLFGWRTSTIDVDMVLRPEDDSLLRALPTLKERLQVNIEFASPADFIPIPEGWEDRSPFIAEVGVVTFHHFDLYAQALAKVERGHRQDLVDVAAMLARRLIEPERARAYFARIEPELYRFHAVDANGFRRAVESTFEAASPPRK